MESRVVDPSSRRTLGGTGLSVSPLCLGCAPLGDMPETFDFSVDEERARETLRAVLESQINFLDTAASYGDGESERRIGGMLEEMGGLDAAFIEAHDGGALDGLRDALCAHCDLKKPQGQPHLTLAYFQAPDGTHAPEELICTIARYRDWPIGEILVENVEMTLLDLRLDYPEPETLALMPLGKAFQHFS